MKNKILGISGSPRKNGNSDVLLDQILLGAESQQVVVGRIYLRDLTFGACIGCEKCRKNQICTGLEDDMQTLYPKITESRGIVLASPTHHYNITAWMKAFIDRLYCFYEFSDERPRGWSSRLANGERKAVICAVCEQPERENIDLTLQAMRLPLQALGYQIIDELVVLGIFDKGYVSKKDDIMKQAFNLGIKLAQQLT